MFTKILVAYDGSEGSVRALSMGIFLAGVHRAELWALAVEERLPRFSATIDEFQEEKEFADHHYGKLLEVARLKAQETGIDLKTLLRPGHAAKTIVDVANEGKFDLVMVGHTGYSMVWAKFLGTTAEKVSRHVSCSILIAR